MNVDHEEACELVRRISRRLYRWQRSQSAVGEESLTDWLLYEMSERLPFVYYVKFSRHDEARDTGADWDWWFVGRRQSLALRIQAKRIKEGTDNYQGIAHTNRHGLQVEKLIRSSHAYNFLPFYGLYFEGKTNPQVRCGGLKNAGAHEGVFVAGATEVYNRFICAGRSPVEASTVLSMSNPLSCWFCCPKSLKSSGLSVRGIYDYVRAYYGDTIKEAERAVSSNSSVSRLNDGPGLHQEVPSYLQPVLKAGHDGIPDWWEREYAASLQDTKALLVVDLRQKEESA